jgi:hypothetical protein
VKMKVFSEEAQVYLQPTWLIGPGTLDRQVRLARRGPGGTGTYQAADLTLPPEIIGELTEAAEEVKWILGPNLDMWQSESRFR